MTVNDMRAQSAAEVKNELLVLLRTQFNLRMQISTQQNNNTSELGKVKKNIARAHTVLREMQMKVVGK
ncbi:MAG: 50S ribosomal protein L29 [Betaproteobacteria bacterium]|jgi:large subunit ribosomal protein L29|nr:50S ribosomal protein L29 [Betaproteobacteria bacterium]